MYNLSTVQLLEIWTQLEDARAGTHGYGGNVAEIYLYLAMRRNPSLEGIGRSATPEDERLTNEAYREARLSLLHVFEAFAEMRGVSISVEYEVARAFEPIGPWFLDAKLHHRVHVMVRPVVKVRPSVDPDDDEPGWGVWCRRSAPVDESAPFPPMWLTESQRTFVGTRGEAKAKLAVTGEFRLNLGWHCEIRKLGTTTDAEMNAILAWIVSRGKGGKGLSAEEGLACMGVMEYPADLTRLARMHERENGS